MTTIDAPPTEHANTPLVVALNDYAHAADREARTARVARNRAARAMYEDGVPVSQLAGMMGMSVRGAYFALDDTGQ